MHAQHNPKNAHGSPSAIDRVAAAVARVLDANSAPPTRDDLIANAEGWIAALRLAISERDCECFPDADDACAPARQWITYLEVLRLNAAVGAPAGMASPGVPVEFALANGQQVRSGE